MISPLPGLPDNTPPPADDPPPGGPYARRAKTAMSAEPGAEQRALLILGGGLIGQAVAAGVYQLAGILLHMEQLDANGIEIRFFPFLGNLNLDPAVLGDPFILLGDLVILGQIGIEILLAIKLAVGRDLQIQR